MKIFLSWSGSKSHEVALLMKSWFEDLLVSIETFISSEIIGGRRWRHIITEELKNCSCGVIFITRDNQTNPWLMFEAGALSNRIDEALVIPILIDLKQAEVIDPLNSFQCRKFNKEGIFQVTRDIASYMQDKAPSKARLDKTMLYYWKSLEEDINKLHATLDPVLKGDKKDFLIQSVPWINKIILSDQQNSSYSREK